MNCEICGCEAEKSTRACIGASGHLRCFNSCGRCEMILSWAHHLCTREPLEIAIDYDIARQLEVITTDFATFEMVRRMTRQEFRQALRERLQEFGDKCLAVWDEKYGGTKG